MNKLQLVERLKTDMVPPELYSLDGGTPHDRLCLNKTNTGWEVYYSERGSKFDVEEFATEESACDRMYDLLKRAQKYL